MATLLLILLRRQTEFNQVLKQDGLKAVKGSIIPLAAGEKAVTTLRKRQRKANAEAEGDETPSKKQKIGDGEYHDDDEGEYI